MVNNRISKLYVAICDNKVVAYGTNLSGFVRHLNKRVEGTGTRRHYDIAFKNLEKRIIESQKAGFKVPLSFREDICGKFYYFQQLI